MAWTYSLEEVYTEFLAEHLPHHRSDWHNMSIQIPTQMRLHIANSFLSLCCKNDPQIHNFWSETRVRNFLERNLKLSKTKRVEGRVLKGHDEALFFWNELIEKRKLVTPFSVIHVDSHADLSYGDITKLFILNDSIFWAHEKRIPRYCNLC